MPANLIISGGSITHGGWSTWKDFVIDRYAIQQYYNLAKVGLGNEAIINRAIVQSTMVNDPVIIIMLTNIDKWDWYVGDSNKLKVIENEKHTISPIHNNDSGGYWSTGSHFPLFKEYYKKHYYDTTYQVIQTLTNIIMIQSYCTKKNIPLLILFDSPIFECFESELNQNPTVLPNHAMLDNPSVLPYVKLIDHFHDDCGLIGYCFKHGIPWYHATYKGHPGSTAHYRYAKSHIYNWADNIFKVVNNDQTHHANKMDKLWHLPKY